MGSKLYHRHSIRGFKKKTGQYIGFDVRFMDSFRQFEKKNKIKEKKRRRRGIKTV